MPCDIHRLYFNKPTYQRQTIFRERERGKEGEGGKRERDEERGGEIEERERDGGGREKEMLAITLLVYYVLYADLNPSVKFY